MHETRPHNCIHLNLGKLRLCNLYRRFSQHKGNVRTTNVRTEITDEHMHDKQYYMDYNLSQCMRFPTIWYVRPAKPQTSLRIRAV